MNKVCITCRESKPEHEYYFNKKTKSHHDGTCKSCRNSQNMVYRFNHKADLKKKRRIYRGLHQEEIKRKNQRYRATLNPNLREKVQLRAKAYRQTDNGKSTSLNRSHRRRTLSKNGDVRLADWKTIKSNQRNRCYWCKQKKKLTMDHVIPLSKGGLHEISNVVAACRPCNSHKNNKLWTII